MSILTHTKWLEQSTNEVGQSMLSDRVRQIILSDSSEQQKALLVFKELLKERNIKTNVQFQDYISPTDVPYHDPFSLRDMGKACSLIKQALRANEKVIILGDYDCDGMTATAILYRYLHSRGCDVSFLIPDRLQDGYGLTDKMVAKIQQEQPDLLITVDCGIRSVAQIYELKKQGLKIILTDHHQPGDELPCADALLNPHVKEDTYPYVSLCGAGIALKVVQALGEQEIEPYIVLASLGTVADSMPLTGENRTIVAQGLEFFSDFAPLGLQLLQAQSSNELLEAMSYGFFLAPRLNAAGRLSNITPAITALISDDIAECKQAVSELEALNNERKRLENYALEEALKQVAQLSVAEKENFLLVIGEDWHPGILGIVAAKLTNMFNVPAIVLTRYGENYRGSGRSVEDFDILACLENAKEHLLTYGGHLQAVGVELKCTEAENVRQKLLDYVNSHPVNPILSQNYTCELMAPIASLELAKLLTNIEPAGRENEQPLFYLRNAVIKSWRNVGDDGKHISLELLVDGERTMRAIAFNSAEYSQLFRVGDVVDLLGYLKFQIFRGREYCSFQVEQWHVPSYNQPLWDEIEELEQKWLSGLSLEQIAQSENLSAKQLQLRGQQIEGIWHYICQNQELVARQFHPSYLARAIVRNLGVFCTPFMILRLLDLATEVGLGDLVKLRESHYRWRMKAEAKKFNLAETKLSTEAKHQLLIDLQYKLAKAPTYQRLYMK